MKNILITISQFLLFFFLFAVGSFLHPFNLHWATASNSSGTRYFVADGFLLALGVLLGIFVFQILRKHLRHLNWTILAFALAILAGYLIKLGFVTTDVIGN